ncbi:ABC transporter ATP-binding protein [Paenibacillus sp. FSL H8-0079]|uniref:ABC transporter ATP-binding protein n=1 Tax=Paenibacillus sp. FSL H8-0079 TaxID=2921375 RepID=UPI0030ECDF8F
MNDGLLIQNLYIGTNQQTLVHDVNILLGQSRCLALIGESGSGKTLTGLAIGGLLPQDIHIQQGVMKINGTSLESVSRKMMQTIRGRRIAYVFQNYTGAFSPLLPLGKQLDETLKTHTELNAQQRQTMIRKVLEEVGLSGERVQKSYSFELSGGQLQRVSIAAAMMLEPELIIADEPTTALDSDTGQHVLSLLHKLKEQSGCSILLITHDLRIARQYGDDIAVMQHGRVVENGQAADVLKHPTHPYTQKLIEAERLLGNREPEVNRDVQEEIFGASDAAKDIQEIGSSMLSVKEVHKTYASGLQVLNNVSMEIREGECLALIGASGSGKSTLARCILQIEPYDRGDIYFLNQRLQPKKKGISLQGNVQAVFQHPALSLNSQLRILDSLMEPLDRVKRSFTQARMYRKTRFNVAEEWMERVGLSPELLLRYPYQLSGGQKQRVCIARSISTEPRFLILDEPTASLDMIVQAQVLQLLKELQQKLGYSSLFISHNYSAVEYLADRVVRIKDGMIS